MKNEKEIAKSNLEMLKSYAKEFIHHGMELQKALKKENEIDAWVVAKAERATTDLSDITHYLDGKSEYAQGGEIDERELRFQKENELLESVDRDYVIVMYNTKTKKNEILTSPDTFKTQRYRYTSLMNKGELAGFEKIKIVQLQDLDFTYQYDGELFAKGGKLGKKATYIPKRDIAEIEVEKNGKTKYVDGANLLDGVYVKKGKYAEGGDVKKGEVGNVIVYEFASQNDYEENDALKEMAFKDIQEATMFARKEYNQNKRKFLVYNIPTRQYFYYGLKEIGFAKGGETSSVKNYLYEIATPMPAKVLAKKLEDLSEKYKVIEGSYKSPQNLESVVMINLTSEDIASIEEGIDAEVIINEICIPNGQKFARGGEVSTSKKANWRFW